MGGPVVPSSGVFTVRVARPLGGQPDLGLTVNEDLVITEVRRGSLAYRTGSLAPGDRLLAIDGQKLDPGDLRQAAQLLHRPGSSVVALTVRKPDPNGETRYRLRSGAIGRNDLARFKKKKQKKTKKHFSHLRRNFLSVEITAGRVA